MNHIDTMFDDMDDLQILPDHSFSDTKYQWSDGWVYFAKSETGEIKIGRSKKPCRRVDHFDTIMPVDVRINYAFQCDDYKRAERELHKAYDRCRLDGEWFDIPKSTMVAFTSIYCFYDGCFWGETLPSTLESRADVPVVETTDWVPCLSTPEFYVARQQDCVQIQKE